MKHIAKFELFEKKEHAPKLDSAILKRLERGVSQGYLKSYDIDFNKKKLHVYFVDPAYGKDATYNLMSYYPKVYDYKSGSMKETNREMHKIYQDDRNYANNFEHVMNDAAKKFVKANKIKGVRDENGKIHDNAEILDLLKASNCKAYQNLTQVLQLIPIGGFKTGKVDFVTKNGYEEYLKSNKDYNPALYSISKTGKIYKMSQPPLTMKSIPPLNTVKDYENALEILFELIYVIPLAKWKARYERDGVEILSKMPEVYLNAIAPKLAKVTNFGVFDGEE